MMKKKLLVKVIQKALTTLVIVTLFGFVPLIGSAQTAPSGLTYSKDSGLAWHTYAQYSVAPTINNGGASVTYSLVSPPAGVTVNAITGQISWDATVGAGSYPLTVTATNSYGSTNGTYFLHVIPNPNDFFTVKYTTKPTPVTVLYGASSTFNNVDVYKPVGDTHTLRPVLMFLHGGGFQSSGTKTESYVVTFCNYFASLGFVCFAPNYNEGAGHTAAQNLAALKDADSCLKWIRNPTTVATYKYDPEFLYFGGGSAGAHLSCNFAFADGNTWYKGYTPNINNVICFADCWGSSPPMSASGAGDRLYNFSSLNKNSMPVYMVQGSADQTVPVQNGIDLADTLSLVGAIHDWWEIAGETHGCPNHLPQISDSMKTFFLKIWEMKYPQTVNAVVTPVKLSYFGVATLDNKVFIKWTTATEENVNHFEVERSMDGVNFSSINEVASKGNSSLAQNYESTDDATLLAGTVYYRLKSIDNNGTIAYSSIAAVDLKATKNIVTSVFPNPLRIEQNLKVNYISTKTDNITFQVVNELGQKLVTSTVPVIDGNNTICLKTSNLKSGLYYLVVYSSNTVVQRVSFIVN